MGEVVLLAGTSREADQYRLARGIRYANFNPTPAQVRNAEVILELPGFAERRDRFTLAQARDSAIKYGRGVQYALDADWTPPLPPEPEPEPEHASVTPEELMVYQLDLTDDVTLGLLKERLNEVGLTLKKLPAKTKAEAPVVDAPSDFAKPAGLSFPDVEF